MLKSRKLITAIYCAPLPCLALPFGMEALGAGIPAIPIASVVVGCLFILRPVGMLMHLRATTPEFVKRPAMWKTLISLEFVPVLALLGMMILLLPILGGSYEDYLLLWLGLFVSAVWTILAPTSFMYLMGLRAATFWSEAEGA